jgi:Transposase IS4
MVSFDSPTKLVGILLISGCHHLSIERDYWSTTDDLKCKVVACVMSQNRCHEMKKFCHFADNTSLLKETRHACSSKFQEIRLMLQSIDFLFRISDVIEVVAPSIAVVMCAYARTNLGSSGENRLNERAANELL